MAAGLAAGHRRVGRPRPGDRRRPLAAGPGRRPSRLRWYCAPGREAHGDADHRRRPALVRVADDLVRAHRPGPPPRCALHYRRRGRLAVADMAGAAAHAARGADPRAFVADRGRPGCAASGGSARRPPSRALVPDAYWLSDRAARLPRCVRHRRRRAVPQLRVAVGAAAGLGPRGAAGPTHVPTTGSWRPGARRGPTASSAWRTFSCTTQRGRSRRSPVYTRRASVWP